MSELSEFLTGETARAIAVSSGAAGKPLLQGPCWLTGWSLRETSGAAAATCEFQSGGNPIGEASLAAGASNTQSLSGDGIYAPQGITPVAISGAFTGCIYAKYGRAD